jgi:hypothetical protein
LAEFFIWKVFFENRESTPNFLDNFFPQFPINFEKKTMGQVKFWEIIFTNSSVQLAHHAHWIT